MLCGGTGMGRDTSPDLKTVRQRAAILIEALPYLRDFRGQTIVVKYGGAAMADPKLRSGVLEDIVLLEHVGLRPIVVHGGGPEISEMMRRLGKDAQFYNGQRITDHETVEIAQMVLTGKVTPDLVGELQQHGGRAIGLSGKDGPLVIARKLRSEVDLGFVGEVDEVDARLLTTLTEVGLIPVIASIASGRDGVTYNVNADRFAGQLAGQVGASKLVMMTDVRGVLSDRGDPDSVVSELTVETARAMIASGQIDAGMGPKIDACLEALRLGVQRCHIIDGTLEHPLLMELFTREGIGTMLRSQDADATASAAESLRELLLGMYRLQGERPSTSDEDEGPVGAQAGPRDPVQQGSVDQLRAYLTEQESLFSRMVAEVLASQRLQFQTALSAARHMYNWDPQVLARCIDINSLVRGCSLHARSTESTRTTSEGTSGQADDHGDKS
jgi:acetylglutamate kinase